MARIIIGCRLPNGLTIAHPNTGVKATIAGMYSSKIIGATHITTEVDAELWEAWKTSVGKDYAPLKSGAIYEARSATEALDKAKDLRKEKTGFEPMAQDAPGVKKAEK